MTMAAARRAQQQLLRTPLTSLLGIRHPIVQGPLNYVGSAELSAAVANGGGLGLISSTSAQRQASSAKEDLQTEIRSARAMLQPDCPGAIGVNLTLLPTRSSPHDEEEEARGKPKADEDYLEVIVDEGVQIVELSGPLQPKLIKKFKDSQLTIIQKCTNIGDAKEAEALGVDAISLDGFECAGPPGEEDVSNWVLQALGARDLVIPFIATGGVANGRQLAAALALGASGVQMGTRFMATQEAMMVEKNNAVLKEALVNRKSGRTALQAMAGVQQEGGSGISLRPHGVRLSVWSCGSVAALIEDVPTCNDLMLQMVDQAVDVIDTLQVNVVRNDP